MRKYTLTASTIATIMALGYVFVGIADSKQQDSYFTVGKSQVEDGRAIYNAMCAQCHEDVTVGAPDMASMSEMSARAVVASLETGKMREQGDGLNDAGKRAVAEWVSGKALVKNSLPLTAYCSHGPGDDTEIYWSGWGAGLSGTGFRNTAEAGMTIEDVPNLELKWAFGFPEQVQTRVQSALLGNQLIVGSQFGHVYSLDLDSGCVLWEFAADSEVRGSITVGEGPGNQGTVYLADIETNVYALDVISGELLWRTKIARHLLHIITGTSALHDGRLYVPISSIEVAVAGDPNHLCCTSSGELVALDAISGKEIWRHRVIKEEAVEVARDRKGRPTLAPSGATVWSSPTVDVARGLVYIGTGENLSRPASETSDSLIAIDLQTGETVWKFQATSEDAWNMSCSQRGNNPNCPDPPGSDLDFGMAPILADLNGKDVLVAGQKSGVVYALDPDNSGELLWSTRLGRGGMLGGIHWGLAVDDRLVYATISDRLTKTARAPEKPGVYGLSLDSGRLVWEAPTPDVCGRRRGCFRANSAAPAVIPGVVFAGALDGHIRAYSSSDGTILWDYDTVRDFETVNGIEASGGALDGASPVVAKGHLIVNSGYAFFNQMPGNVLLVFQVPQGR